MGKNEFNAWRLTRIPLTFGGGGGGGEGGRQGH